MPNPLRKVRATHGSATVSYTHLDGYKGQAYTLEFCGANSGGGLIDPSPTNPADPDDADVDPTPGTGGEEILSEPIRFSVTVDEWKDAAPENMDM